MNITDNQNEIFDLVDEEDNVIGKVKRGEANTNKNLIHRSIGVAVFNNKGEMYLQQRSATKDTDPLKWTIACSGHVNSGETYEETVLRELNEELGINKLAISNLQLREVAKYICRAPNETEMVMLYKTQSEGPFKLHSQEIAQGKFFTRKELNKMVQLGKLELSYMGKVALEKLGWIKL